MKAPSKSLTLSSFWIAAGLVTGVAAHATPTGNLTLASVTSGEVALTASRVDFSPPSDAPPGGAGEGDFATGDSVITHSGGVLTALTNPYGAIQDIEIGGGAITNFIQFYVLSSLPSPPGNGLRQTHPAFDLSGLVAGGPAQGALSDCAGVVAVGISCSPRITPDVGTPFTSPLVITNRGAYTVIALGLNLQAVDATGSIEWVGGLTTRVVEQGGVRMTPDVIQTILNEGGTISSTYSATFTTAVAAP